MADEPENSERFLSRWSKRKHEAARAAPPAPVVAAEAAAAPPPPVAAPQPLPPVESLTIDSDFSVFLQPSVADDVKRAAMKKLFADPRFNVMDGLDVYIDDYTQPDPMPAGMLDKLKDVYRTLTAENAEPADAPPEDAAPTEAVAPPPTEADAPPPDPAADPKAQA